MNPDCASIRPNTRLAPGELIGLFLMRLVAYMARLERVSDKPVTQSSLAYLAQMVASAEGLVHAFVRMLTAEKLKQAGYIQIAEAMRTPAGEAYRAPSYPESRSPDLADLQLRLKACLTDFEQADILACTLARIIVCALNCPEPDTRSAPSPTGAEPAVGQNARQIDATSPALPPRVWPPPSDLPKSPPLMI